MLQLENLIGCSSLQGILLIHSGVWLKENAFLKHCTPYKIWIDFYPIPVKNSQKIDNYSRTLFTSSDKKIYQIMIQISNRLSIPQTKEFCCQHVILINLYI